MASSFSGDPTLPARRASGARRARTHAAGGADLDILLDRWVKQLEGEGSSQPPAPSAPRAEPHAAGEPGNATGPSTIEGVMVRGGSVTFVDAPGERVELNLDAGAVTHLGTVGVRGPLARFVSLAREAGLDEVQGAALEHVAAWFGAPFDAVSAGEHGEQPLRFGFFRFGGDALARCLEAFARRDAAAFAAQLGRYGVGVAPADGAEAPAITLSDPASGAILRGHEAELVLAGEPRLVAVLSRAGRNAAAQAAQVEAVVTSTILPALRLPLPGEVEVRAVGTALRSGRELAGLFYTALLFGLRGAAVFVQTAPDDSSATGEETRIERFAARLDRSRRTQHAHALRRIGSSPELV